MFETRIHQKVEGERGIFTATGDIYIYNYPKASPADEQPDGPDGTENCIPPCPYRGLFAFRPEHVEFFFGRETITESLLATSKKQNFIALIGASGSGKSSVIFAGLVPRLHQTEKCLITHLRPTNEPFQSLARSLLPLYDPDLTKTDRIRESCKLARDLRSHHIALSDVISVICDTHPNHRVFLIADQFEELYTLSHDPASAYEFIDILLSGLTGNPQNSLNLILVIRADFLGHASLYRPLADALQGATEILGPMNKAELTQAIEEPAKRLGVTLERGLTDRILGDVGQEAGNLPLLEFALTELWAQQQESRLTHNAYTEIGEVKGALSRYADKVFAQLNSNEKAVARRIFVQLVKPGRGTEDTRRRATRTEIGKEAWALVSGLATKRLVVTDTGEDTQETVELIHEALIRSWQPLRTWMDEDRDFRIWQERLRNDVDEWLASNKSDDALIRSFSLAEAEHWLNNRPRDLSETEQALIDASLKKHRWQQQQRQLAVAGALAAVVIITVLVIFSLSLLSVR